MKRILTALVVVVLVSTGLGAVENSVTFMPLVGSTQFSSRVTYIIAMEAPVIQAEAATGSYTAVCHTLRAGLARNVAANPSAYAPVFSVHLVANINVTSAGALTGSLPLTLDSPVTDAAVLAAVASLWSTVAGCVANP